MATTPLRDFGSQLRRARLKRDGETLTSSEQLASLGGQRPVQAIARNRGGLYTDASTLSIKSFYRKMGGRWPGAGCGQKLPDTFLTS